MANIADRLKSLQAEHASLIDEFRYWRSDYEDLAKFFLPRKCRLLQDGSDQTNRGGLRTDVLDETGILAVRTATAGMHGGMTSPSRPWSRLGLMDTDLAKRENVRRWLDECQQRMRTLFARSNFYQAMHQLYGELLVFGTNFMFEHHDERAGLRFNALTVGEYVIDTDENGRVDTVYRTMEMTAKNIVRMFGYENCSSTVQNAYDTDSNRQTKYKVIHAILPREERNPFSLNNKDKAWASYYYEDGKKEKFLREGGYDELPGYGPRWDVTGQDVYGQSPSMDVLRTSKMNDSIWATYLKQEHKRADPPVAGNIDKLPNLLPGGTNKVSASIQGQALYPVYQVTPDPAGMLSIIQDIRSRVREGLYNDLFKMLALSTTTNMTATEVAERHEEKLLQLGPVLERLHAELFTPLIDRTFNIMASTGMLPPWPDELAGASIKVDFVSLLAQAQKMVATTAVDQYMGFIGSMTQFWPDAADIPDTDAMGDRYAEYLGIEDKLVRTQEDRDSRRQARMQQQQTQDGMAMMQQGAQTTKSLADAPMGEDSSALDKVLGTIEGGA